MKANTNPSALELGVLGLDSLRENHYHNHNHYNQITLKANTKPSGLELKAEVAPEEDWPVCEDSLKARTNPSGLELNMEMPALLLLTPVSGPDNI